MLTIATCRTLTTNSMLISHASRDMVEGRIKAHLRGADGVAAGADLKREVERVLLRRRLKHERGVAHNHEPRVADVRSLQPLAIDAGDARRAGACTSRSCSSRFTHLQWDSSWLHTPLGTWRLNIRQIRWQP